MTGATGNLYCGLHEFEEIGFLLHALHPGALFVDVGANIGSYALLAAGVCEGDVVAMETVGSTFACLLDNIALNGLSRGSARSGSPWGRLAVSSRSRQTSIP